VKPLHQLVRSVAVLQVPGLAAGLWTTTGTEEAALVDEAVPETDELEVPARALLVELEDATLGVVVGRLGGPRLGGPKLSGRRN